MVNSSWSPAQPQGYKKPDIQEKTWQRVELSKRLCEFSACACEFIGQAIDDVRRTRLYPKEMPRLQRERLDALSHKLNARQDKGGLIIHSSRKGIRSTF